jgi:hypothetical protein
MVGLRVFLVLAVRAHNGETFLMRVLFCSVTAAWQEGPLPIPLFFFMAISS